MLYYGDAPRLAAGEKHAQGGQISTKNFFVNALLIMIVVSAYMSAQDTTIML
jgi:hypothetical protein